ncbi:MAG: V-type ATPase subunit [Treponema sp.]|jgi:vacuolar-type H+-ATPase subunit C/Vma6|nr:V-type ATPase subunit [Treponema sp.]
MLDAGSRCFAYAKACGIIRKSFVGKRISALADIHSLNEFERSLFPVSRDLPGEELLVDLEKRIIERTIKHITSIIVSYEKPPLLVHLLRSYEYSDLKTCLHYIDAGKKEAPPVCGIGTFQSINFNEYPDIPKMLENCELKNLQSLKRGKVTDSVETETEIDRFYYQSLKDKLLELSNEDRIIAQILIADEISIKNCIWAFRLRSYFQKTAEETRKYLMDISMPIPGGRKEVSLLDEALKSLDYQLDMSSEWKSWKWEKLLNPESASQYWSVDAKYFQNAASKYLYHRTWRYFRRMPMSVSMVYCFIKLKQFEEDILTSIIEGIGLGMSSNDVLGMLEIAA